MGHKRDMDPRVLIHRGYVIKTPVFGYTYICHIDQIQT